MRRRNEQIGQPQIAIASRIRPPGKARRAAPSAEQADTGQVERGAPAAARHRRAASAPHRTNAAMPTGTLIRNVIRQPMCGAGELDDQPADHRARPPTRCRPAPPISANARGRSRRGNRFWMKPETCGLSSPPTRPCSEPGHEQHLGFGREADDCAGDDEAGRADEQHPLAAAVIAEAPGDDRHQPERRARSPRSPIAVRTGGRRCSCRSRAARRRRC